MPPGSIEGTESSEPMKHTSIFSLGSRIVRLTGMLSFLVVFAGPLWLAAPHAAEAANSTPQLVRYFVSWHVTEHGSSNAARDLLGPRGELIAHSEDAHRMKLEATGSAIVRYRADNGHLYDTQFLNVNLLHNENSWQHTWNVTSKDCMSSERQTNIDPSAYSGFHADAVGAWDLLGGSVDPARRHVNRLENAFFPLWGSMKISNRRTRDSTCEPPTSHESTGWGAPVNYQGRPNILAADSTAANGSAKGNKAPENTSFSVNRQFTYVKPVIYSMLETRYVTWTGHAYRIGKCFDHDAPIKAGDPIINHEKVDIDADNTAVDPNPDVGADTNVTQVRIRVTCDGVPVENAVLLINVDAQDKSGGHIHSDDDRPRGTIDGQKVGKEGVPGKNTDRYGQVRIKYGAPLTGSVDPAVYGTYNIGIAGTYKIKAKTTDKFAATGDLAIIAKVDELQELPPANPHYMIDRGNVGGHPAGSRGTGTTLGEFVNVADDFYQAQNDHNTELQNCQKSPWGDPVPVSFNDITLPDGGIFDLDSDWLPSHQTHNRGEGGDFNRFNDIPWTGPGALGPDCNGPPVKRRAWLLFTLLTIGQNYGHWDQTDLGPACNNKPPTSIGGIKSPSNNAQQTKWNTCPWRLHLHVQD